MSRTIVVAIIGALWMLCGCSRGHRLEAPKAMLSEVLFVELDDIVLREGVLDVRGSVANLTDTTIWIKPSQWRYHGDKPIAAAAMYEIPRYGVAYVRLRFDTHEPSGMLVVSGVYRESGAAFPHQLGEIPIGDIPADAARARAPATADKQPHGKELIDRDCGSGPLVTCPR